VIGEEEIMSQAEKYTVIDPRGQPPARQQTPMAPRLDTLDNKKVYIVNVNWPYTRQFGDELCKVLSGRYPKTKFEPRDKAGTYMADDPELWKEIKEKGNAAILTTGH
jgi:hypothetical protein